MRFKGKLTEAGDEAGRRARSFACGPRSEGLPSTSSAKLASLGRIAQAEAAFREADEYGKDPEPGLSLLRLGQGNVKGAPSSIRRALGDDSLGTRREPGSCPQPSRSRSPRTSWTRPSGMSTSSSRRPTRTTRPRSRPQEPSREETSSSRVGTRQPPTAAFGRPGLSGTPRERPTTSHEHVRLSGTLRASTETRSARSGSFRPPQLDTSASALCAMPNGLQSSSR